MKKEIIVFGSGCANCERLHSNVKNYIEKKGLDVSLNYITDLSKMIEYDIMRTPALVIDGKVVSEGKVLSENEIEKCLID